MSDVIDDPVLFARDVLSIDVFAYQQDALRTKASVTAGIGGRRAGKTLISQCKALRTCLTHRDCEVVITSANESSVRRWVSECASLLTGTDLGKGSTVDIESMRIRLANGSEIIGLAPTAGALRGRGRRTMGLVIDEASLCSPTLWTDARFVLLDNADKGAWAFVTGPPSCGPEHWFRQLWNRGDNGDPDVLAFAWSTLDNPRLDADFLRRELASLNSVEAEGEIHGRWVEDGLQFFSHKLLESVTADLDLPAMADLHGPARPIAAFDFGLSYDSSAAAFVYRLPVRDLNPEHDRTKPVFVLIPYVWPAGEMLATIVDQIVACPAPAAIYGLEQNGISGMPSQEIQRRIGARKMPRREVREWNARATTQAGKLAGYSCWRWLFERGQAVIPRDPTLHRQLAGLRLDTGGRGGKIEAGDPSVHDDVCDSMMLCAAPYPGHDRINTRLAELAGPRAVPDGVIGQLDLPVMQTGAGLNVYAKPPLQSVGDTRVTIPAGVKPAVYRNDEFDVVRREIAAAIA